MMETFQTTFVIVLSVSSVSYVPSDSCYVRRVPRQEKLAQMETQNEITRDLFIPHPWMTWSMEQPGARRRAAVPKTAAKPIGVLIHFSNVMTLTYSPFSTRTAPFLLNPVPFINTFLFAHRDVYLILYSYIILHGCEAQSRRAQRAWRALSK